MNRYPPLYWRSHARAPVAFGGVDGGECSADVLKITWPSQVDDFKARLGPIAQGIDASVRGCAEMTPADQASWASTFTAWSTFAGKRTPFFGSSNEWETACSYSRTLDAWRTKLAGTQCAIAGPAEIRAVQTNPVDLVRWIAIGAGVIGAVMLGIVYAPEIKLAASKVLKR